MKKIFILFFAILLLACATLGLASCGKKTTNFQLVEIGDSLPIYPDCEFNYKVSDNCTVRIESMTVTLVEKNEVSPGDTLTEPFSPCVYKIEASGSTDPGLAGEKLIIRFSTPSYTIQSDPSEINNNGSFTWEIIVVSRVFLTPQFVFTTVRLG